MLQWLYRYLFRGIGVLFAIGMITILALAISSQLRQQDHHRPAASGTGTAGGRPRR